MSPEGAGLTLAEAARRALEAVVAAGPGHDLALLEESTQVRSFGWVFFFAPRRWLQTRSPGDLIPGLGPVAVERATGRVHLVTTSVHPERALAELERRLGAGKP